VGEPQRGTQGSEKRGQTALSTELGRLKWVDVGLVTELSVPAFRTARPLRLPISGVAWQEEVVVPAVQPGSHAGLEEDLDTGLSLAVSGYGCADSVIKG